MAAVLLTAIPPCRLTAQFLTPRDSALHALSRLAYGPRPGEVDRVARFGVMRWIEEQLQPERIADPALAERGRAFAILAQDPEDLARMLAEVRRERRAMQQAATRPDSGTPAQGRRNDLRRLAGQFQQLVVVRAVVSERQLFEVMADFWTNHFNVFYAKGADRFLTPAYIEETIRPHALGTFHELLAATAKSPAMLFYLDNAQSVAPGSSPPGRRMMPQRMPRGLNENYARELLELHTLGVDGGYTQDDVVAVARIFTGWGIARPGNSRGRGGVDFEFRDWAHDDGEKTVLGVRFQAGGMEQGVRLLEMLAQHHATMHHVSRKLCARFVADEPPDGCVDAAVDAWHESRGDIRAVLRAIFRSPDFWAPATQRAKVKTPLEFVTSAVRAVGGVPDTTPRLAQVVARLGQPLYLQPAPTGYPETQADWVNAGALLNRMNVAVGLASGKLPGVRVDLDRVVPRTTDYGDLITLVNQQLLGSTMSAHTQDVIRRQVSEVRDPADARVLAVGLAIGGPEFQRQ